MKTKISRIGKKSLSVIIALMMIVSTMLVGMVSVNAASTTLYFNPGDYWKIGDTYDNKTINYFVAYFFGSGDPATSVLTKDSTSNLYSVTALDGYSKVIFVATTTDSVNKDTIWSNKVKQTGDLTIDSSKPLYTLDSTDDNDNKQWSEYTGGSGDTKMYYVRGNLPGTDWENDKITLNGPDTNGNYTYTFSNVSSGTYVFKLRDGSNYVSHSLTTDSSSGVSITKDKYENIQVVLSSTADVTIIFNPDNDKNTKVVLGSDTPPAETNYYIGGRFKTKTANTYAGEYEWDANSTNVPFVATSTSGLYKVETGLTISDLSANSTGKRAHLFLVRAESGSTNTYYGDEKESSAFHSFQNYSDSANPASLTTINVNSLNDGRLIKFDNASDTSTSPVTIYLDTNGGMKLWYTTDGSTPSGQYKLADKSGNYGKVEFKVGGKVVTSANENDEVTATVIPNTGFSYVANSFSVTNDTLKLAVGTPEGTTLTFTMPASDVTATAKFELNKAEYVKTLDNGLYVDVAPDKNDTTATFVKWNNYTGSGQNPSSGVAPHNTKEVYTLYLPANVNLNSVTLYNAFDSNITFDSKTIDANSSKTVSLSTDKEYSFTVGSTPYKFNVMQGSTSSMFLYTNDGNGNDYDLPTSKKSYDDGLLDKETIKASGGLCTTIKTKKAEDGSVTHTLSDALDLSQVKGRGNSSWQASCQIFGKYAFNMKLSSATSLFGLPQSKSFCLLANNMDYSMLRNAYIYQLAKDIGLYDSPEFEFVDIYDNGEYMGAYLVTEKVDVGKKDKLIKGNSIEKLNEDKGAVFDEDHLVHSDNLGYATIISGPDLDKDAEFKKTYQTTGTYLLEFEIQERVQNEPSYFKSSKGQNVVLKNPEFATRGEVEFIKEKFDYMESLVYPENNAKIDLEALSKVMDLDSFARMYLIQEFTSNLDSAATSYYITYDCSKGLFVASPVWDYDMALGQNSGTKKAMDGTDLTANDAEHWFAKLKAMGDGTQSGSYSLQSKLATDSNFQKVIKKVWFGKNNDGFYDKVKPYYANGGQLDKWLDQVLSSYKMNEARWQFIQNQTPGKWNAPDTTNNNGFAGAVDFLKNNWSSKRVTWLNNEFNNYSNYTQIAAPTLTAYTTGDKPLTGTVTAGDTYVLKATTSEIYVDYVLYDGETQVGTANTTGVFTIENAEVGIHSYTVKTVYGSDNVMSLLEPVVVTVAEPLEISSVTISTKTNVNVNEKFTLTATASPNGLTGVTYTFYKDGTEIPEATDIESNTFTTRFTAAGSAEYQVKATLNGRTVESAIVKVTAEVAPIEKEVTIYFKSASASVYVPSLSVDGETPAVMTRDAKTAEKNGTYFGSTYSGSLKFYWFYTTMTIDASKEHTLVFTTKDNRVNAKKSYTFSPAEDNKYYFAVDNLMGDTNLVDLTREEEYIRNYHISATHMVRSVTEANNVGFTWVQDNSGNYKEYAMGTYLNDKVPVPPSSSLLIIPSALNPNAMLQASTAPSFFTVKSATLAQRITAEMEEVSTLQYQLLDVNLDGVVDVKDSTMMQKALAGI